VASAAAELLSRRALEVDIVFLIEGEEENGSAGFKDAVQKHKVMLSLRSKIFLLIFRSLVANWRHRCNFS